jgi:RNA recognition motif-containing protein
LRVSRSDWNVALQSAPGVLAPVGSMGSTSVAGGGVFNPALTQYPPLGPTQVLAEPGLSMSAREREIGTLGAMGFSAVSSAATVVPSSRDVAGSLSKIWDEENRERERKVIDAMGLGVSSGDESSGPFSAKEGGRRRAETKIERDERQPLRLRSGSAFEAFHSVPHHSLVSPPLAHAKPFGLTSTLTSHKEAMPGPWDHFANVPIAKPSSNSSRSSSVEAGSTHSKEVSRDDEDVHTNPEMDPNDTVQAIDVAQIARAVGSLAVATTANAHINGSVPVSTAINGSNPNSQGNTSPQLPSPASGSATSASTHSGGGASGISASAVSSSSSMRHAPNMPSNYPPQNPFPGLVSGVDQNPPINTLYVGNLPISPPPPGYPPDILEDSLRELFRTRPGFRRLSFKQKSTGPMCFVEFEDVGAATKTINELYGNTLNGLVKGGGIRLSYSKNPLGVRTPTSASGPGPILQQQHLQQQQRDDRDRGDKFGYGVIQALSPTPHHPSSNHRSAHTHEYMISPPPPRFAGASTGPNIYGNFSSSSSSFGGVVGSSHVPAGSGSNFMFGMANSFQGGAGQGPSYRMTDSYNDAPTQVQGQGLNAPFSPFDGHLDHPNSHPQVPQISSIPMQHQGPNPNQNQNF